MTLPTISGELFLISLNRIWTCLLLCQFDRFCKQLKDFLKDFPRIFFLNNIFLQNDWKTAFWKGVRNFIDVSDDLLCWNQVHHSFFRFSRTFSMFHLPILSCLKNLSENLKSLENYQFFIQTVWFWVSNNKQKLTVIPWFMKESYRRGFVFVTSSLTEMAVVYELRHPSFII